MMRKETTMRTNDSVGGGLSQELKWVVWLVTALVLVGGYPADGHSQRPTRTVPKEPLAQKTLVGLPAISGFSSANARPGQTLQVLGNSLSFVTSVAFLSAERDWTVPGRYRPIAKHEPRAVTHTPGSMNQLSVEMPSGTWATDQNNARFFLSFPHDHPLRS